MTIDGSNYESNQLPRVRVQIAEARGIYKDIMGKSMYLVTDEDLELLAGLAAEFSESDLRV